MKFLLENHKVPIDFHKPSIDLLQDGQMTSPIYAYFRREYKKMTLSGDQLTLPKEHVASYFGEHELNFKLNIEYFEFLSLFFTPGV